ncbi:hypothetical protein ES708_19245 [subsurface metagenome]
MCPARGVAGDLDIKESDARLTSAYAERSPVWCRLLAVAAGNNRAFGAAGSTRNVHDGDGVITIIL